MFRNVAQIPLDFEVFKGYNRPFNYIPSGAIRFGNGVVADTGDLCVGLGLKKVVISTDEGLVKFGVAQKVIDSLEAAGVEYKMYDKCEANPSVETVEKVAAMAKEMGAEALIGIGGGSSIDPAKSAAILCTNDVNIRDCEGNDMYENAPLPVIAIPTSSGTGTEATPFSMITDVQKQWKMAVNGSAIIPALAICDPELTATLPPMMTAATGMDALTHAIEGFVSRANDPISDALLAKAIKLVYGALQRATFKGLYDKEARYDMMLGSTLAGMGFTNAVVGISHSMAHPLGAVFNVPHGVGNAICLPIISRFNMYSNLDKFAEIADLFGKNTAGMDKEEKAQTAVDALFTLVDTLPIPPLSKWGITDDDAVITKLAEEAMKGGDRYENPRETTLEDFKTLYLEALKMKA